MARADLLIQLVQSALNGDRARVRSVVESIIAEERSKQHKVLAGKLEAVLRNKTSQPARPNGPAIVDPRVENLVREVIPQRKIDDLILPAEVRQISLDLVQEHHRRDLLGSHNLEPRNRILLIGPPGNGKTSLAEAIAQALMLPMYVVRYDSVVGAYLGETASRLRRLVDYAATRMCVLFFDEFETVAKERGDTHETGEIKRLVSSLLMQIDALPTHVVVIGATNHPELLDRGAWRRFQVRMELPQPTQARLAEWFDSFARRVDVPLGFAPTTLAKRVLGSSFAEAEEFAMTALRQYALDEPGASMKTIISRTLKQWPARSATARKAQTRGGSHA